MSDEKIPPDEISIYVSDRSGNYALCDIKYNGGTKYLRADLVEKMLSDLRDRLDGKIKKDLQEAVVKVWEKRVEKTE
jgi:hypothetical protein